nr:hypothetical protein [Tanacetum cinerariifolium]
MMASFFQMNTASTLGSGPLPANPKGELKAITTRTGIVLDGPSVHMHPPFINQEEDKRVDETLTDQDLTEYTIKVPPPLVQKHKPPSQRNYVVHQRDPLHPNIPYPSRIHKQKQQEKDEVKIHKFWQMFNDANSSSSSEIANLTHAVNQQTSVVTTAMTAILKQFQANPPPASVKAVKEICVTCDGAHPYYQCLVADGNTFSELQDNIQGYVLAAAVNYN